MLKTCTKCKAKKPTSEFAKNKSRKDGLQTWCRPCKKTNDAEYRLNNMDYFIARASKQREELYKWYYEYKSKLSCKECGESHPACVEFHHRDRDKKEMEVSKAISRGWSVKRILSEIEKCDILCSNCHRKEEYNLRHGLLA